MAKYRYIITHDHRKGQDTLLSDAVGLQGPAQTTLTVQEAQGSKRASFTLYNEKGPVYQGIVVGDYTPRALLSNFKGCTRISIQP